MNEEIKEILDNLFDCVFNTDWKKLLDYITNLQQELQEANDSVTWWNNRFNAAERNNRDYKSRIDKAIEYIGDPFDNYWQEEANYLINILKGDSDE